MAELVTISGLSEVQEKLRQAPSILVAKLFHKALDRGIGVIAAEVEARCPQTYLAGNRELRESIITPVEIDLVAKGGSAAVGFSSLTRNDRTGKPMDLIALWVEYGHEQLTREDKLPKNGQTQVPPHPFMRPAAVSSAERAVDVFADVLLTGIDEIGDL